MRGQHFWHRAAERSGQLIFFISCMTHEAMASADGRVICDEENLAHLDYLRKNARGQHGLDRRCCRCRNLTAAVVAVAAVAGSGGRLSKVRAFSTSFLRRRPTLSDQLRDQLRPRGGPLEQAFVAFYEQGAGHGSPFCASFRGGLREKCEVPTSLLEEPRGAGREAEGVVGEFRHSN